MIIKTASKGQNKGNKFWGCPNFPKCRQIVKYQPESQNDTQQPAAGVAPIPQSNKISLASTPKPQSKTPKSNGRWDSKDWHEIINYVHERDNKRCGLCGGSISIAESQIDHIVPRIFVFFSVLKGGIADAGDYYHSKLHGVDNLQAAHDNCNKNKGNKKKVKWWRHTTMPPLVVAVAKDGKEFSLPWKKPDGSNGYSLGSQ